ncbi:MAG: hypothetical protein PVF59_06795, partial [Desulfobacterales bacterium]
NKRPDRLVALTPSQPLPTTTPQRYPTTVIAHAPRAALRTMCPVPGKPRSTAAMSATGALRRKPTNWHHVAITDNPS